MNRTEKLRRDKQQAKQVRHDATVQAAEAQTNCRLSPSPTRRR